MSIFDQSRQIIAKAIANNKSKTWAIDSIAQIIAKDGTDSDVATFVAREYTDKLTKDIIW